MNLLVWIISALNVYLGMRCFLNAIHVLHTAKYSQTTTVIFAILFLGFGAAGFHFTLLRPEPKLALLICFGPWLLAIIVVLFLAMIFSRHQ